MLNDENDPKIYERNSMNFQEENNVNLNMNSKSRDRYQVEETPTPVTVAVRLKPNPLNLPISVQANPTLNIIQIQNNDDQIKEKADELINAERNESFDYVFNESTSQETVYSKLVSQFVPLILVGYDYTLICAGQSNSGKSFTMFGSDLPYAMNERDFGINLRLIRELFHNLQNKKEKEPNFDFDVQVSFLEIFNTDEIFDVLSVKRNNPIHFKDYVTDDEGNLIDVSGIPSANLSRVQISKSELVGETTIKCFTINDVIECLETGLSLRRKVSASYESDFSNSEYPNDDHTILTLHIRQSNIESSNGQRRTFNSTVRLLELAGSDRVTSNRGLIAINNVASALGDARRGASDAPQFHSSNLTRILREALGGTSITVLLTCLSTLSQDINETENSIEFSKHMRNIKTLPQPNINVSHDRRDSDSIILRSASVDHGIMPHVSLQRKETGDSSEIDLNTHSPRRSSESSSGTSNTHQINGSLLSKQVQETNTQSHIMPENVNPQLFNQILQQQILQQYQNQIIAAQLNANMMNPNFPVPQLSSPMAPGYPQISPHLYWQMQQQNATNNAMQAFNPSSIPINLSSKVDDKQVEKLKTEADDQQNNKSNEQKQHTQKLASIIEESEGGSISGLNENPSHDLDTCESSESELDEEASLDQTTSCTSSTENFDSEASIISEEDENYFINQNFIDNLDCAIDEFNDKLNFDLISPLEKSIDYLIHKSSKLSLNEENVITKSPKEKIQVSQNTHGAIPKRLSNNTCENVKTTEDEYKRTYSKLRDLNERLTFTRQELAKRHCVLSNNSANLNWDEAQNNDFVNITKARAQLDEFVELIDVAKELKSMNYTKGKIELESKNPDLDIDLTEVIGELSIGECRALVDRLLSRAIDLRGIGGQNDMEKKVLQADVTKFKQKYRQLQQDVKVQRRKYERDLAYQAREYDTKLRGLQKSLSETEKLVQENERLRQDKKFLMKFYRDHQASNTHDRNKGDSAPNSRDDNSNKPKIKNNRLIIRDKHN